MRSREDEGYPDSYVVALMEENFGFLSTKLKMPVPRTNYISRRQLYKKLEDMRDYKLTLIKGAAGSGKTTLLTSFIRDRALTSFRWISLDEDDNDVLIFWNYFLGAINDLFGEQRDTFMASFKAVLQKEDMKQLVSLLINRLASQYEDDLYVVLDDFQNIRDEYLLKTIEFFISHSPENIRLVLLTREEPALYTGNLLIAGRLLQITEEDMRLSRDEGMLFLRKTLGVDLPEGTLNEINRLAEGWIGGIQLIALASAKGGNPAREVKALGRHTVDYLSREILGSLEDSERDFLIKTSILSYFDKNMCDRFLDSGRSEEMIAGLLDKNLFIVTVDENRGVYRYHNIFGEFLKLRFAGLDDGMKRAMHLRAAEIFESSGDIEESVRHLLKVKNYARVLEKISIMEDGQKRWRFLRDIPLEYIKDNRDIVLQLFFYYYCNMEWEQCKRLLESVSGKIESDTAWRALKIAKALIYDFDFEMDVMSMDEIENMQISDTVKALIFIKTSAFLHIQDKNRESLEFIQKAAILEEKLQNPYIQYFILTMRCQALEDMGELLRCEAIYQEAFRLISRHDFLAPLLENNCIGITGVYLKSMALDRAEEYLNKAGECLGEASAITDIAYLYNLMELKILKGQKDEALEILHRLMGFTAYYKLVHASGLLRYAFYFGDAGQELLREYINSYESLDEKYVRTDDRLMYSLAQYGGGNAAAACAILDEVLRDTRRTKTKYKLVEAILLKVAILNENFNENKREIFNLLREAIYYSYENRILSPYFVAGEKTAGLLSALRESRTNDLNKHERAFIGDIIRLFEPDAKEEVLSERELQVLLEMSTGASNREIGERLYISLSTVKTHIVNIYSKLEASNRVEALDRARELGLLQ